MDDFALTFKMSNNANNFLISQDKKVEDTYLAYDKLIQRKHS